MTYQQRIMNNREELKITKTIKSNKLISPAPFINNKRLLVNNRIREQVTNFKNPSTLFPTDVINAWLVTFEKVFLSHTKTFCRKVKINI